MKYYRFCLALLILVMVGGCDFLNYDESTIYTKNNVFNDFGRTKSFLTNIYSKVPDGFNQIDGAMRASAVDESEEIQDLSSVQDFNDGSWSAIQTLDSQWSNLYSGIRAANQLVENFNLENFKDREYNDDYDQIIDQAELFPYQARFLRALFYFKLIKRYGEVPLVTEILTTEEANTVESASYQEITDFIVNECEAIAPELPVNYSSVSNQETGRATRGAAMALKARALLYAASPLHNISGDAEKWIAAAEASKAIIDSSWYALENSYSNIINNRTSNELILGRRGGGSNGFERANFPIGYEGVNQNGTAPTQNLVDAYKMQATGLNIDDSRSGYNPANPYEGRDPRLQQTIIVNNSIWKGQTVEIWDGGNNGPPQDGVTKTGYYLKKGTIEGVSLSSTNSTTPAHTWVLFRYGEVLLNYAEAMNEAYGPENPADMGMTARQAVNMVRNRANMPPFPAGMTQAEFRQELRNERRVELAFEDHRFWDVRRWQIGPSTTDIYGVDITREADGSFSYDRKLVEERVWGDRMYLYPIPQSELFINEALEQNPGW